MCLCTDLLAKWLECVTTLIAKAQYTSVSPAIPSARLARAVTCVSTVQDRQGLLFYLPLVHSGVVLERRLLDSRFGERRNQYYGRLPNSRTSMMVR